MDFLDGEAIDWSDVDKWWPQSLPKKRGEAFPHQHHTSSINLDDNAQVKPELSKTNRAEKKRRVWEVETQRKENLALQRYAGMKRKDLSVTVER